MDDKFNFHKHITIEWRKSSQRVGVLLRLRKLIPTFAMLQLYKSAILLHLSHCHLVWHSCRASDKRKLEGIQERTLRAVFNSNSLTYKELLHKANLPSSYSGWLKDIAVLMYKVKNSLSPSHKTELFNRPNKRYELRNADVVIPRYNIVKYGKHSVRYYGPYTCSKWDVEDQQKSSLGSFKRNIRNKDLEYLVDDNCTDCFL